MLAELAELHPQVREAFTEASDGAGVDLCVVPGRLEKCLNRTEYTSRPCWSPASACGAWRSRPSVLSGHSLGEYTALVAAGALSLHDGAHLVRLRGQLMGSGTGRCRCHGRRARCRRPAGAGRLRRSRRQPGGGAGQLQFAGPDRDRWRRRCGRPCTGAAVREGVRKAVKLAVSVPSHTPLMREAANRLAEVMAGLSWQAPQLPVVQNVDAQVHDGVDAIRTALVQQLYQPVQWTGCVQALAARGITQIAECGPGKVLTGLVKRIDKAIDGRPLATPATSKPPARHGRPDLPVPAGRTGGRCKRHGAAPPRLRKTS